MWFSLWIICSECSPKVHEQQMLKSSDKLVCISTSISFSDIMSSHIADVRLAYKFFLHYNV